MSRHAFPNHIPGSQLPVQARYGEMDRLGNHLTRNSYPSYNNTIIASHATPTLHSTSPSRIPEIAHGRSRSPYNVLKDIAAVSTRHQPSMVQSESSSNYFGVRHPPIASHGGYAPQFDNSLQTPYPRHYMQSISGPLTRPTPVASTSAESPALVQPGNIQSKTKKRKAYRSPSGSDTGNDVNAAASRAHEEEKLKNTKAQASSKEREKERHWLALLRRLLFGEETTYSTRHNGVRQVEVTHTKLKVLQGAFDRINELQKRVDTLETLLEAHRQRLQDDDTLMGFM